jgi:HAMP domain-containing protein
VLVLLPVLGLVQLLASARWLERPKQRLWQHLRLVLALQLRLPRPSPLQAEEVSLQGARGWLVA